MTESETPTGDVAKTILALRAPIEPSHGVWEIYRRQLDAFACMIEQNEVIAQQLREINASAEKASK